MHINSYALLLGLIVVLSQSSSLSADDAQSSAPDSFLNFAAQVRLSDTNDTINVPGPLHAKTQIPSTVQTPVTDGNLPSSDASTDGQASDSSVDENVPITDSQSADDGSNGDDSSLDSFVLGIRRGFASDEIPEKQDSSSKARPVHEARDNSSPVSGIPESENTNNTQITQSTPDTVNGAASDEGSAEQQYELPQRPSQQPVSVGDYKSLQVQSNRNGRAASLDDSNNANQFSRGSEISNAEIRTRGTSQYVDRSTPNDETSNVGDQNEQVNPPAPEQENLNYQQTDSRGSYSGQLTKQNNLGSREGRRVSNRMQAVPVSDDTENDTTSHVESFNQNIDDNYSISKHTHKCRARSKRLSNNVDYSSKPAATNPNSESVAADSAFNSEQKSDNVSAADSSQATDNTPTQPSFKDFPYSSSPNTSPVADSLSIPPPYDSNKVRGRASKATGETISNDYSQGSGLPLNQASQSGSQATNMGNSPTEKRWQNAQGTPEATAIIRVPGSLPSMSTPAPTVMSNPIPATSPTPLAQKVEFHAPGYMPKAPEANFPTSNQNSVLYNNPEARNNVSPQQRQMPQQSMPQQSMPQQSIPQQSIPQSSQPSSSWNVPVSNNPFQSWPQSPSSSNSIPGTMPSMPNIPIQGGGSIPGNLPLGGGSGMGSMPGGMPMGGMNSMTGGMGMGMGMGGMQSRMGGIMSPGFAGGNQFFGSVSGGMGFGMGRQIVTPIGQSMSPSFVRPIVGGIAMGGVSGAFPITGGMPVPIFRPVPLWSAPSIPFVRPYYPSTPIALPIVKPLPVVSRPIIPIPKPVVVPTPPREIKFVLRPINFINLPNKQVSLVLTVTQTPEETVTPSETAYIPEYAPTSAEATSVAVPTSYSAEITTSVCTESTSLTSCTSSAISGYNVYATSVVEDATTLATQSAYLSDIYTTTTQSIKTDYADSTKYGTSETTPSMATIENLGSTTKVATFVSLELVDRKTETSSEHSTAAFSTLQLAAEPQSSVLPTEQGEAPSNAVTETKSEPEALASNRSLRMLGDQALETLTTTANPFSLGLVAAPTASVTDTKLQALGDEFFGTVSKTANVVETTGEPVGSLANIKIP